MRIVLTSMVFAAALGSALPAGAQQPLTPVQQPLIPVQPNTPYTIQPMAPSYAPPRHVTRKRYRRGRMGYARRGYYPVRGYYLSAHQLPPVYYPPPPRTPW
jgi:hypothetical protein